MMFVSYFHLNKLQWFQNYKRFTGFIKMFDFFSKIYLILINLLKASREFKFKIKTHMNLKNIIF